MLGPRETGAHNLKEVAMKCVVVQGKANVGKSMMIRKFGSLLTPLKPQMPLADDCYLGRLSDDRIVFAWENGDDEPSVQVGFGFLDKVRQWLATNHSGKDVDIYIGAARTRGNTVEAFMDESSARGADCIGYDKAVCDHDQAVLSDADQKALSEKEADTVFSDFIGYL